MSHERSSSSPRSTYAKLNGTYGCQNPKLMHDWLRGKQGFDGYVVSDQGAIHDAAQAINAGCDVEVTIVGPCWPVMQCDGSYVHARLV